MDEEKRRLRRLFSGRRSSLTEEERRAFDEAIREKLRGLPLFVSSPAVAAFCASGAEPDLLPALGGKRLFLPRYNGGQRTYELVEIADLRGDLVPGRYGIAEPRPGLAAADRDFVESEVLFLGPAVACDRTGTRLGRGGGFYDRLLGGAAKPPVGVIYSCQLGDALPREEHDVPLGWVVTETEVIKCSTEGRPLPNKE
ncbi:MAG: 5-formyltetrahydrofolate cyclo-ligase [Lentisphaeria bacterium]|nr:5-formyltetrahydrofolate cyclo-ligase [Lentisphaeria bacterium]